MKKETCRNLTKSLIWCRGNHLELYGIQGSFFRCHNKECDTIENLTIHHEIYPKTKWGIIRAINTGKIYMLCKECHNKLHQSKKKNL